MFEWDDVKYFLAVARHGSTLAAAKALNLSQSTVQRRVTELERKLGRGLVKRHATGYRLTEFGEEMLPYAEQIERAALAFEQRKATPTGSGWRHRAERSTGRRNGPRGSFLSNSVGRRCHLGRLGAGMLVIGHLAGFCRRGWLGSALFGRRSKFPRLHPDRRTNRSLCRYWFDSHF
jgi:molybdenum-dependent DNA-binding transcriptional regulator ModE